MGITLTKTFLAIPFLFLASLAGQKILLNYLRPPLTTAIII